MATNIGDLVLSGRRGLGKDYNYGMKALYWLNLKDF